MAVELYHIFINKRAMLCKKGMLSLPISCRSAAFYFQCMLKTTVSMKRFNWR